jgi:quinol monooxygenase YgiN
LRPDRVKEFVAAMREQAKSSLQLEPGCLTFDVCCGGTDEAEVFLYELYSDAAAFEEHLTSAHYRQFAAQVADWTINKQVSNWRRLEVSP